jgi:hypothetical protein
MRRWDAVSRSAGNVAAPRSPTAARSRGLGSRPVGTPQIVTAHVDEALVADRIESDCTITPHADVAAELLRAIGHADGVAHRPHA